MEIVMSALSFLLGIMVAYTFYSIREDLMEKRDERKNKADAYGKHITEVSTLKEW